jgi:hypothetical protein
MFLGGHHLNNIVNRQQSLRDLYLTIKEMYFIADSALSNSLTILYLTIKEMYCIHIKSLSNSLTTISLHTPSIVKEFDKSVSGTKYFSFIVRYKSRNDCCLLTML